MPHKTADEMADVYNFTADQRAQLAELLAKENHSMWSSVLCGIGLGNGEIVVVVLSQIGNAGGEPYWSWYGFTSRVEWCACFVSWCANECGYLDAGVIPKTAGCIIGSNWFKTGDYGRITAMSRTPATLSTLTGTTRAALDHRTVLPTMLPSWRRWRTVLSTPWRAILAIAAGRTAMPLGTMRFMAMEHPPIDL